MSLTLLPEPLRGALRPRVEVRPQGVADSLVDEAAELALRAGLELDGWQRDGLELMLAIGEDGRWACPDYAEWVSRQNGKSVGLLTPRALLGFLALGEHLILWSSHRVDTTMRSFKFMEKSLRRLGRPLPGRLGEFYIEFPDDGFTVKINGTHGHESFERLDTNAECKFVARSARGARGMDPECLILDEAFALNDAQMEAQGPSTAAQPNAQVILTSTPPLDGESGQVMFRTRERAESDDPGLLGYRDWGLAMSLTELAAMSANDRRAFLDDRGNWKPPNPSLGSGRLGEAALQRLRRILSEEGFARECLGIWPTMGAGAARVIAAGLWDSLADSDAQPVTQVVAYGIDANPERTAAAIGAAGRTADGDELVFVAEQGEGLAWVVERAVALEERHEGLSWSIHSTGPARSLIADLEAEGIAIERVTDGELAGACGGFFDVVSERRLRHLGDRVLDDAVDVARKRHAGGDGGWAWGRRNSEANISPLMAVTLARHGLVTAIDLSENAW